MSRPGFNAVRTWRTSQALAHGGTGLCTIGYILAATGHSVLGAVPFLAGLFLLAYGKYRSGHASAFLSQFAGGDR